MEKTIPPGSTIGVLGGGQLGRMLAIAAARLGYHAHIFCPEADAPAAEVAAHFTQADYTDVAALERFAKSVDVVTLEFENVPVAALEFLQQFIPVRPSVQALSVCQHRLSEKEAARACGIATAPFAGVRSAQELKSALQKIGLPAVVKTTRLGYDGKGQVVVRDLAECDAVWRNLRTDEAIVEGFVAFERELSVVAARSVSGEVACFPPVHNIHRNHILYQTIAPAPISAAQAEEACRIARLLAEKLDVVGLLAVELFQAADGALLVNEMAPRTHNSGHWTLDACATSQFEQQLRAVCGLPLGSTEILCPAVMTNLIGDEVNAWETYLREPNARLHLYGKKEARPGRKMGHVTHLART